MWGSTAVNFESVPLTGSAWLQGAMRMAANMQAGKLLLIVFDAVVPILIHVVGTGKLSGANQAEAKPLGICFIPDALWKLRVLFLP